jgi:rhodanese-related sulfurtransferase
MNLTEKPLNQSFHLEGVKHISPKEAFELISDDKVFFIDVREEEEFRREYFDFDNVFFHPMSLIMDRLQYIPKNIPLVIVCNEGVRSTKVANLLRINGFEEVANLDGGIYSWKEAGFPMVESGLNDIECGTESCNTNSCGCGCNGCG